MLRNGLVTLLLAVALVVSLVAIPRESMSSCAAADAQGDDAGVPTYVERVRTVGGHIYRGRLPCESPLTRSDALYVGIARLLARSATLVLTSMTLALCIAVPLGMRAARDDGGRAAARLARVVQAISSLPVIVWATVLFGLALRAELSLTTNDMLAFGAAVCTLLLGDRLLADLLGRVREATRELLGEPHLRTVRASGFNVARHLAQGLVPPVAEAIASRTLFLVGGAIVAERLFGVRGLGSLVFDALKSNPLERELVVVATMTLVLLGVVVRTLAVGAALLADGRRRS